LTGRRHLLPSAILLFFLAFGVSLADESGPPVSEVTVLSGRGLLALATGTSTCLEGTHVLTDPCTGFESALLDAQFSSVNLDGYLCQYVSVSGQDVGIECPIIGVQNLALVQPPPCLSSLSVFDSTSTWLQWPIRPCAVSYDVVRGVLPGPQTGGGFVNLGPVVCLVNDLFVPSGSIPSTLNGPHDEEVPPLGQIFFYLVRATLEPSGVTPYGFSSAGEMEVPASGDCAP
jgi:hypothetical protein